MAPSRMASCAADLVEDAVGQGLAGGVPAAGAEVVLGGARPWCPSAPAAASSTFRPSATTSGPMPSPGTTASRMEVGGCGRSLAVQLHRLLDRLGERDVLAGSGRRCRTTGSPRWDGSDGPHEITSDVRLTVRRSRHPDRSTTRRYSARTASRHLARRARGGRRRRGPARRPRDLRASSRPTCMAAMFTSASPSRPPRCRRRRGGRCSAARAAGRRSAISSAYPSISTSLATCCGPVSVAPTRRWRRPPAPRASETRLRNRGLSGSVSSRTSIPPLLGQHGGVDVRHRLGDDCRRAPR